MQELLALCGCQSGENITEDETDGCTQYTPVSLNYGDCHGYHRTLAMLHVRHTSASFVLKPYR